MAKMMEYGAVGPAHELLAERVGTWTFEMVMHQPGQPPADPIQGTSEIRPILDGRLALGTWQGIYLWEHRRAAHTRELVVHVGG